MQVEIAGKCISLADFCRKFILDEKVFVVPSYHIGHQIGERLAADGSPWINLRFVTPSSLALEAAGLEMSTAGLQVISPTAAFFLVEQILDQLDQDNKLNYFNQLKTSPGIVHVVMRALENMRKAGQNSGTLQPGYFEDSDKGREICLILQIYEQKLAQKNMVDTAGLFILAQKAAAEKKDNINRRLLVLSDLDLDFVELNFLATWSGSKAFPVLRSDVFGLQHPPRLLKSECGTEKTITKKKDSNTTHLSWLFAPEKAPPPGANENIKIFKAVGSTNECREVVRRILRSKIPLDTVEVIHPPGEEYPAFFFLLCESLNLKASFGGGIPLRFSRPGILFSGLLDWLENDYKAVILSGLLESGVIALPAAAKAGLYLKQMGIGWGRERYRRRLLEMTTACKDPVETAVKSDLKNFVLDLLACIPNSGSDSEVDLSSLSAGLAVCLDKYAQNLNEFDKEAQTELKKLLIEAAAAAASRHTLKDALSRLRFLAGRLSIGASLPLPGYLFFSDYSSGGFTGRETNFIVGLEQNVFPGTGIQDPILLDEERERISLASTDENKALPSVAVLLQERLFAMARMIAALRGSVTLSYPSYNILDNKPCFPSSLILQAFRLQEGRSELDYSLLQDKIGDSFGYRPERAEKVLDGTDWWLNRLISGEKLANGLSSVNKFYPELMQGYTALHDRRNKPLTEYDGSIGKGICGLDPLLNKDLIMSATRWEILAECPFKYLLQYILEVRPPEELEYGPTQWLNARQRGLLLHDVFYRFMQNLHDEKEKVSFDRHRDSLRVLGDKVISEFQEEIPPPSEGIFRQEQAELHQALRIFLKVESQREDQEDPVLFEVHFGLGKTEGEGVTEAVEINLGPDRSFLLRGQIDRIDRLGKNRFRVLDYKTGRYNKYQDLKYFGRGRITQHALYGIAAEQILIQLGIDEAPQVSESGYFFPTYRGDGYEVMVKGLNRSRLYELLRALIEIIKRGEFIHSSDARCDFCDFLPVCGKEAKEKAKLWRDSSHPVYAILKGLKEFP